MAVTLPAAVLASQNGPPQARILCVDDDEAIRMAVIRILERHGHRPVGSAGVEDARHLLEEHDFDLAILDIQLPTVDGITLLKEIKIRAPRTVVVMLSAHGTVETAIESVRAGAFDFVEKPFDLQRLVHTVERALEHGRLCQKTTLAEAGQIILATRDFDRLPEAIVKVSMDVMSADTATLLLPGVDGMFYVAHAFGMTSEIRNTTRIAIGEGVAGRVAQSKKGLVINGDASRHSDLKGVVARTRIKSSIVFPIVAGHNVAAILTFNRMSLDAPYRAGDLETAGVLASQVLLALENVRLARQGTTAEKLAAVGQLAAGIAHEINTPLQFINDSLRFLSDSFADLNQLVTHYERLGEMFSEAGRPTSARSLLGTIKALSEEMNLADLRDSVPRSLTRAAEGIDRVAAIVRAVKEFGRPDCREKVPTDINQCLSTTLTVCKNEYRYVADAVTDFTDLPPILCHPGELNQVFLNLITNAAHAIADVVSGTDQRGTIVVRTSVDTDHAVVAVEDTGGGIPVEIQPRIFDPFFTTKQVGRGTGLGLSVARTIIERHGGSLSFQTELGRGTRFCVRLPFEERALTPVL